MRLAHQMMARAFLRRRRAQAVLLGLVIAAATMLTVTALGVLRGADEPFAQMMAQQRGSHLVLVIDQRQSDAEAIRDWWQRRDGIAGVTALWPALELDDPASVDGRELGTTMALVEHLPQRTKQDQLRVVAGQPGEAPAANEVWVPTSFASTHGLAAGDTLEIPTDRGMVPLTVGAVVVDPQFSAPFTQPVRLWIAPDRLPSWFGLERLQTAMLGVRYADPTDADAHWAAFSAAQGGAFAGLAMRYELICAAWLTMGQFLGALLLVFALVALGVAWLLIHASVTNAILAETRQIGVLQALGFAPRDLVQTYLGQFRLVLAAALPLGLLAGAATDRAAQSLMMGAMGVAPTSGHLLLHALVASLLVTLTVGGAVRWVARRAGRVPPGAAIRFGAPQTRGARWLRGAWLRRLPNGLGLALRLLLGGGPRRALALAGLAVTSFVLLFGATVVAGFGGMGQQLGSWGFDDADVRVVRGGIRAQMSYQHLLDELRAPDGVAQALGVDHFVDGALPAAAGQPPRTLMGAALDGSFAELGFEVLQGRHPQSDAEVALAVNSARDLGATRGDTIALRIGGRLRPLEVVGLYQTVNNMGQGFRVQAELLRQADPLYDPPQIGLLLAPGANADALIASLEARFGELVDAQRGDQFLRSAIDSLVGAMAMVFGFLGLLFLVVTTLSVANQTVTDVQQQRRSLGVWLCLGMTPNQARGVMAWSAGLAALVGVALGALGWSALRPSLLDGLLATLGISSFPATTPWLAAGLVPALVVALSVAAAWWAARGAACLNVRTLMAE